MTKIQQTSKETLEKEYKKLVQHVKDHYFIIKSSKRNKYWEIGCWLGKEPTGKLFRNRLVETNKQTQSLEQLAKDMYEYLYTNKGSEITKKDYERQTTNPINQK